MRSPKVCACAVTSVRNWLYISQICNHAQSKRQQRVTEQILELYQSMVITVYFGCSFTNFDTRYFDLNFTRHSGGSKETVTRWSWGLELLIVIEEDSKFHCLFRNQIYPFRATFQARSGSPTRFVIVFDLSRTLSTFTPTSSSYLFSSYALNRKLAQVQGSASAFKLLTSSSFLQATALFTNFAAFPRLSALKLYLSSSLNFHSSVNKR